MKHWGIRDDEKMSSNIAMCSLSIDSVSYCMGNNNFLDKTMRDDEYRTQLYRKFTSNCCNESAANKVYWGTI